MTANWNDTAIGTLRRMWGAGATSQRIADALNLQPNSSQEFTRNGVIGKAHRLLLNGRPNPISSQTRNPDAKRYNRRKSAPTFLFGTSAAKAQAGADAQAQLANEVPPKKALTVESGVVRDISPSVPRVAWDGKPVRFADLQPGQCKWIIEPTRRFFADQAMTCAAPVHAGRAWCAAHCVAAQGKAANPVPVSQRESDPRVAA